jgi:hypothetical protein
VELLGEKDALLMTVRQLAHCTLRCLGDVAREHFAAMSETLQTRHSRCTGESRCSSCNLAEGTAVRGSKVLILRCVLHYVLNER